MKIFLIRHGSKETTPGDPPLSAEGILQTELTGKYMKQFAIDKIISSPFARTKQTAEIIGKELNLPYVVNDKLIERMNWGDFPNQTFHEFLEEWNTATVDRDFISKTGDSSRNAGKRLESIIKEEFLFDPTQNLVLVTHGGIITDFLRNVFTEEDLINSNKDFFENISTTLIRECSVTRINFDGKYSVESIGTTDHLASY
jgi:broad specificity phosphatase PhoE